jgi:hypothetical protein
MKRKYESRKNSSSPEPIDPRIKWLRAMICEDLVGAYLACVEIHRDPKRWFGSAVESGMPHIWARGESEADVRTKLECSVGDHAYGSSKIHVLGDWKIVVHPPDDHGDGDAWVDWPADGAAA